MATLPPLGLWIDCPPRRVLEEQYWDQLAALGVTTAAIMVSRSEPRWSPVWDAVELTAATQLAIERDMEVVLTVWPSPRKGEIDALCHGLTELLLCGCVGVELDVEGLWERDKVRDFHSLEEAEQYLMVLLRRICDSSDVRVELTTHTGHRECGPHARLTPCVDRFLPQLYSVRHRPGGKVIDWRDRLGPGRLQRDYLPRCRAIPDVAHYIPKLCVGLSAWSQRWPGHSEDEAMQMALDAVLPFRPFEVRYWSSKHVMKSPVVAAFLAQRWGR